MSTSTSGDGGGGGGGETDRFDQNQIKSGTRKRAVVKPTEDGYVFLRVCGLCFVFVLVWFVAV